MILAIDPGPVESGWCAYDEKWPAGPRPIESGIWPNAQLLEALRFRHGALMLPPLDMPAELTRGVLKATFRIDAPLPVAAVIEAVQSYGMPVGESVFQTVWWSGRFVEALWPNEVVMMPRVVVKRHLCHAANAKDANVAQALVDRFGGAGGRAAAIGTKKAPGPLYGVKRHIWSALALAVTYTDLAEAKSQILEPALGA